MQAGKPLAEIHRPKTIANIILPSNIKTTLQRWLANKHMPAMIMFLGPPGSGKTTTAYAFAREILGHDLIYGAEYDDFLEFNAASKDERNIEFAQQLEEFASVNIGKLRIIFCDEADQITPAALGSLRATIEKRYKNVRFIMCGNKAEGFRDVVGDAILSRATKFDLPPIPINMVKQYAMAVATAEKIKIPEPILDVLCEQCEGDLRRILNDGLEKLLFLNRNVVMEDITESVAEKELAAKLLTLPIAQAIEWYINARAEIYINSRRLLKELFIQNGRKKPKEFAQADVNLRDNSDPLFQFAWILTEVKT